MDPLAERTRQIPRFRTSAALALALAAPLALAGHDGNLPAGATPEGRILMLEDQRVLDLEDGLPGLKYYLRSTDTAIRARAALAAGRIADPEAAALLRRALGAGRPRIRRAAAFALGEAGFPSCGGSLRHALRDPDPEVRALAAEALSKLGAPASAPALRRLLEREAAGGDPRVLERLLLTAWRLKPEGWTTDLLPLLDSPHAEVADAAVFFLTRRPEPEALEALQSLLAGGGPTARRAWAARALGGIRHPRAVSSLLAAAGDEEPAVAIEALRALARSPAAAGNPRFLRATSRPELHVRLEGLHAVRVLAAAGEMGGTATVDLLVEGLAAPYPEASAALGALALVDPDPALPHLQQVGTLAPNWRMRAAAADILGDMRGEGASSVLDLMLEDEDPRVVWHALAAWTERIGHPPDEAAAKHVEELALAYLHHDDVVVRAVAAAALQRTERGRFEEFASCYLAALDDPMNDAALACLQAAAPLADLEQARQGMERIMECPDPVLRLAAGRLWEGRTGKFPRRLVYPVRRNQERQVSDVEALRGYSALASGDLLPRSATVRHEGGEFRLELFPDEAPLTVYNFARLARQGFYDGLEAHRVIPQFVVQDGDPRGDGWGGPGYSIRDEINLHRYEAGTVGMALSGPDTGGSQWFVALAPQPHLDGGYTVFGRVVSGLEDLQSFRQGARILAVRVAE